MDTDSLNDKYSIKNLLFYRAIPPHVITEPTDGHKIYSCIDCGDRFVLESSYLDHINRKSVKISYKCRHCSVMTSQQKVFYNRCNLLSHIRSHSFRTATINVGDLKVEPLPACFFKIIETPVKQTSSFLEQDTNNQENQNIVINFCFECKENITQNGPIYKDRASHYMKYTNKMHSCPFCLLTLPTLCGLKAHMRIHLLMPPYFCPECGAHLSNKIVNYPYNHHCESFNMMRATVRIRCIVSKCKIFHPNDFKNHMTEHHLKKVFKCPFCVVACFNESTMNKHLGTHPTRASKPLIFYQCELCPGRLVLQNHLDTHLNAHIGETVYPCWTCGTCLKDTNSLLDHHLIKHKQDDKTKSIFWSLKNNPGNALSKKVFRVVKRCDQCLRSFNYKCQYDEINILPNACPFKCTSTSKSLPSTVSTNNSTHVTAKIKCPLCKNPLDQEWEEIKKHYAVSHKNHVCLDGKISLDRMEIGHYTTNKKKQRPAGSITKKKHLKTLKRSSRSKHNKRVDELNISDTELDTLNEVFVCCKCKFACDNKLALEEHMITHRDPCMAYQCMECSECFVVKPSFSTHLFVKHGLSDVDEYIAMKQCYNKNALDKYQLNNESNLPLKENQCKVCREEFQDSEELEKHFRMHGMAFLMKNSISKPCAS